MKKIGNFWHTKDKESFDMKYLLLILFLPFILGVAVSPVSLNGDGEIVVINNLDQEVEYVVKSDYYVSPERFSLDYGEEQRVSVSGAGEGQVIVYEVLGDDVSVVNAVAVKVHDDVGSLITGNAALSLSDLKSEDYAMWGVIGLVVIVLGVLFVKKKGWRWLVLKAKSVL